jgi:hypothetical protein
LLLDRLSQTGDAYAGDQTDRQQLVSQHLSSHLNFHPYTGTLNNL